MLATQKRSVQVNGEQLNCNGVQILQSSQLSATFHAEAQMLLVQEHDNPPMKYPAIWLRDNCLCEECFHADSLSRKPMRWNNFDTKVKVNGINVSRILLNTLVPQLNNNFFRPMKSTKRYE